jgi:hypothetical protein
MKTDAFNLEKNNLSVSNVNRKLPPSALDEHPVSKNTSASAEVKAAAPVA